MHHADSRRSDLNRREVLAAGAAAAVSASLPLAALAHISATPRACRPALVVLHLRGGADGLSLCIPFTDPALASLRADLLPPPSGARAGCIPISDRFAVPRELEALIDPFRRGHAAVVHAAGFADASRSHAAAQQLADRTLAELCAGVAVSARAASCENKGLRETLANAGDRLQTDGQLALAEVEHSGYDTHVDQLHAAATLSELAAAIRGFHDRFIADASSRPIRLVVITEFGRTLGQNAQRGTDHGNASAVFVFGRSLPLLALETRWPELSGLAWHDGLPVTTDIRSVIRRVTSA